MSQRTHLSLQRKLFLAFVLVMLIPIVVLSGYVLVRVRAMIVQQVSTDQLRLLETQATLLNGQLVTSGSDLIIALKSAELQQYVAQHDNPQSLIQSFATFLRQSQGRYTGLCLLDVAGNEEVCVRAAEGAYLPVSELRNRADAPGFQRTLLQAQANPGLPLTMTRIPFDTNEAPRLDLATTYLDDSGAAIGVLVLEMPLEPLFATLHTETPDIEVSVVEYDGTFLFEQNQLTTSTEQVRRLDQIHPESAATILGQSAGILIKPVDAPGKLLTFARVSPSSRSLLQWTLIYEQPINTLLGGVTETYLVIGLITGLSILVALSAAHLLSMTIVRPIQHLAAAAEQIGAGNLSIPIPQTGPAEIRALGQTLDQTVSRLQTALTTAEQRRHEAEALASAMQMLSASLNREEVLGLIFSELRKVVPYDSASVQAIQGDTSMIIGCYGLDYAETLIGVRFSLQAGTTPNAQVAHSRTPLILNDAIQSYPHFNDDPSINNPVCAWMGVPMLMGDRLLGIITLDKYEPGFYTVEHARLVAIFATQAAIAMEHARLYEEVSRELADRRRAEAAYARLAAIIESTNDLVGMARPDGEILFLNTAGRHVLGILPNEDLATMRVVDLYPPSRLTWLRTEAIPTVMREGIWSGESIIYARDGTEIPVEQVILAHRTPDGQTEFISTIAHDMRERMRAEEQLRESQKMEALGRLAGGVAHDFNNLLTVIMGEADLILSDPPDDEDLRTSITQIRQSGERAATLTRQLLAFSRRQVLQTETISLNEVLTDIEQLLRSLIGERIQLQISLDPDLPLVRADPGQMTQVVMNLVINARDAMPDGGMITLTTTQRAITPAMEAEYAPVEAGTYAVLTVRDTGQGMDEQTRDHIFEPFFTTKSRGKGTGLGLATVHGIVRQSGGKILFASQLGQGTQFVIYLPVVATAELPHMASPNPTAQPRKTKPCTILLVEDDANVRELTRQLLSRMDMVVLEASDGEAALAIIRSHPTPIDLLLTDVVMPGKLNGFQLGVAVQKLCPTIRTIYMSGYSDTALRQQALADQAICYLQKPFTADELARALHTMVA
ncbi:ATP-binding protein [Candidatus Chloroploca asiatica]|uniref:histidine kinase n=1 Tax=Candidatus Chloroploca asiatica TaxID=1506545 RepID=A0A2H3KM45_9CHLR|nr:ATP-binding protein [Candidatus Chloroploca asiatica]PDV98395.1 hypothetical protein A9Q02_15685 [Candidatus Chloroploca asiatica]